MKSKNAELYKVVFAVNTIQVILVFRNKAKQMFYKLKWEAQSDPTLPDFERVIPSERQILSKHIALQEPSRKNCCIQLQGKHVLQPKPTMQQ